MYNIKLMNCLDIFILNKIKGLHPFEIIMTSLTEDEEKAIDDKKVIRLVRGKYEYTLDPNCVYCYGDVNFGKNSSDMNTIAKFDFSYDRGLFVPANYNYETHTAMSDIDKYKMYDTTDIATIVRYAHGCLNKPKKVIIFKNVIKKWAK